MVNSFFLNLLASNHFEDFNFMNTGIFNFGNIKYTGKLSAVSQKHKTLAIIWVVDRNVWLELLDFSAGLKKKKRKKCVKGAEGRYSVMFCWMYWQKLSNFILFDFWRVFWTYFSKWKKKAKTIVYLFIYFF